MEDKSNGSPPATLRGLHLFSAAMGPGVSGPPFQRRCGPPGSAPSSITASRAAVGTKEEEGEDGGGVTVVAERQADTSRDKMVGEPKKTPSTIPHPSTAQKREGRQMRRRI